jgi:hypothetical protein
MHLMQIKIKHSPEKLKMSGLEPEIFATTFFHYTTVPAMQVMKSKK